MFASGSGPLSHCVGEGEERFAARLRSFLAIVLLFFTIPLWADEPRNDRQEFRVCADPNNLPFSNRKQEGFENKIAELLARELQSQVAYTWWPQRRGFIRNTLSAGVCDVVMGVPAGYAPVLTTRPYYRSTYVFVYRRICSAPKGSWTMWLATVCSGIMRKTVRRAKSSTLWQPVRSIWRLSGGRSPAILPRNKQCRSLSCLSLLTPARQLCRSPTVFLWGYGGKMTR